MRKIYLKILRKMLETLTADELDILLNAADGDPAFSEIFYRETASQMDRLPNPVAGWPAKKEINKMSDGYPTEHNEILPIDQGDYSNCYQCDGIRYHSHDCPKRCHCADCEPDLGVMETAS